MPYFPSKKRSGLINRSLSLCCIFAFVVNLLVLPVSVQGQAPVEAGFSLPLPGTMLTQTQFYSPPTMTGVVINPEDPLEFEFMITQGDAGLDGEAFQKESEKLIKYFLSTLTIPEEKLWVNLSPYERDQMISPVFGETEMGRDLLGQDYLLKQLSASLMNPKDELGKKFWDRVYAKAYEVFQTKDIPVNTFNKVWIVPEKADIYENETGAFIVDSHLKVMLEEDYLALQKNMKNEDLGLNTMGKDDAEQISQVTTQVIREVMLPEIEKEVNEGSTFANLRQIYNAMILGAWYKKSLKESFLGQVYVDQNKIAGIDLNDPTVKQKIFDQYLVAFQKGVYNYMERNFDPQTNEIVIQKYFSGGFTAAALHSLLKHNSLASLNSKQFAAAASPIMSSSFTGKGDIIDRFNSLPPAQQAELKREVARLEASSPMRSVKVTFTPDESKRALDTNIAAQVTNGEEDLAVLFLGAERITADVRVAAQGRIKALDQALRLPSPTINFQETMAGQKIMVAEGVKQELGLQGVTFTSVEIENAIREVQKIMAANPEISIPEARKFLITAGIREDVADATASQFFREGDIPETMMRQRVMVEEGVKQELGRQWVRVMPGEIENAAREVQKIAAANPEISMPEAKRSLITAGVREDVAGVTADLAFGVRSVDTQAIREYREELKRVSEDAGAVVDFGSGSIAIPGLYQEELERRDPVILEATQIAQRLESGQLRTPVAPLMVERVSAVQQELLKEYDQAPPDQKIIKFYQIQATANLVSRLKGEDPKMPQYGLSENEQVAVRSGRVSTGDRTAIFKDLNRQLSALLTVKNAVGNDSKYSAALQQSIEKVNTDIDIVSHDIKRDNEAKRIVGSTNNPTEVKNIVAESSRIDDFTVAVNMINEKPVFAVNVGSGAARAITPAEAVSIFRDTQSTVRKTPQGNTLLVENVQPRGALTPGQDKILSEIKPIQARFNAERTVARLRKGSKPEELGGIDLNPSLMDLNIKKDGKGVTLPLLQQSMELINSIQGFVPVITDISPATFNMPMILGQEDSGKDDSSNLSYQTSPLTSMAGVY